MAARTRFMAFLLALLPATPMTAASRPDVATIFGKIQIVDHGADYKVRVVDHFADLHVQVVEHFPDKPGKWQMVDHFPDHTIQFVEHFPDFTIKYVDHFPGPQ